MRAGFLVAFFGGAFANVIFAALNARRADRLKADAWFLALLTLVSVASTFYFGTFSAGSEPGAPDGGTLVRLLSRGSSILLFGAVYLRHRSLYTASELRGESSPSAWGPGLAAIVAGAALGFGVALLGVLYVRG